MSGDEEYVAPGISKTPLPSVEITEYVGFFPFGHYETRGITAEELGVDPLTNEDAA